MTWDLNLADCVQTVRFDFFNLDLGPNRNRCVSIGFNRPAACGDITPWALQVQHRALSGTMLLASTGCLCIALLLFSSLEKKVLVVFKILEAKL